MARHCSFPRLLIPLDKGNNITFFTSKSLPILQQLLAGEVRGSKHTAPPGFWDIETDLGFVVLGLLCCCKGAKEIDETPFFLRACGVRCIGKALLMKVLLSHDSKMLGTLITTLEW